MKFQFVFFDLDGTLLDTLDDLRDSVNTILGRHDLPPITRPEAAHFLGNGAAHLVHSALKGRATEEAEQKILEEYKLFYQQHCRIRTAPYAGVMDLLADLKRAGVRMAVVSNKPDPAVKELNTAFFGEELEAAIGEKPGVRRKPAPDTLFEAMRLMGAERENCVYIGDTEVDIQTAKNAAMPCISVSWGFRSVSELKEAGADIIADSAEELKKILLEA